MTSNNQKHVHPLFQHKNSIFRQRCYAFATDVAIILIIKRLFVSAYGLFIESFFYQLPSKTQSEIFENTIYLDLSVSLLLFWGYFVLSFYMGRGQTIGKLFFSLKVVDHDFENQSNYDEHLSFKASAMRTLGYFMCYLTGGMLFLVNFFRRDTKGLPDFFSKTFTVSESHFANAMAKPKIIHLPMPETTDTEEEPSETIAA